MKHTQAEGAQRYKAGQWGHLCWNGGEVIGMKHPANRHSCLLIPICTTLLNNVVPNIKGWAKVSDHDFSWCNSGGIVKETFSRIIRRKPPKLSKYLRTYKPRMQPPTHTKLSRFTRSAVSRVTGWKVRTRMWGLWAIQFLWVWGRWVAPCWYGCEQKL